jgi:PAS domain-containing protein
MKGQSKTKQGLIQELSLLRQKIAELEQSESDSKNMEKALRQSGKQFKMIVNNTRDVIWTPDMNLQFTFMSSAIEK